MEQVTCLSLFINPIFLLVELTIVVSISVFFNTGTEF